MKLTYIIKKSTLILQGTLNPKNPVARCTYKLQQKHQGSYRDIDVCDDIAIQNTGGKPCSVPYCSNIVIQNYNSNREHKITVEANGISQEIVLIIGISNYI